MLRDLGFGLSKLQNLFAPRKSFGVNDLTMHGLQNQTVKIHFGALATSGLRALYFTQYFTPKSP
jgi:hypothetical protein